MEEERKITFEEFYNSLPEYVKDDEPENFCPHHPDSKAILITTYQYVYPNLEKHTVMVGWVCEKCFRKQKIKEGINRGNVKIIKKTEKEIIQKMKERK